MLKLVDTVLGFIAPHQCYGCGQDGSPLCASCQELLPATVPRCYRCGNTQKGATTCTTCKRATKLRAVHVRTDYEGIGEFLLRGLKFERVFAAAAVMGTLLAEMKPSLPQDVVIVPVPTATSRVRLRGYDQSVLIARELSRKITLPYAELLERHGQQRQTGSGRRERQKQLEGAFKLAPRKQLPKAVLLVDDVLTTGATLEAAAQAFQGAGVNYIYAIVFARAT